MSLEILIFIVVLISYFRCKQHAHKPIVQVYIPFNNLQNNFLACAENDAFVDENSKQTINSQHGTTQILQMKKKHI